MAKLKRVVIPTDEFELTASDEEALELEKQAFESKGVITFRKHQLKVKRMSLSFDKGGISFKAIVKKQRRKK